MSDLRESGPTPEERKARDAVAALPSPRPDAAYRQRVARAFVSGALRSTNRHRPVYARRDLWGAIGAAAALVLVALALNRGPDWRIIESHGFGTVLGGARPLTLQGSDLEYAIRRGARVRLAKDASLDIVAPGVLAMNIEGGSDVVLPRAPNRWWWREAHGHVYAGNAFISTGRDFHGATLAMETPEAVAHVTGTSLAVLRDREAGTCVCVMEGRVVVSYHEGRESVPVPAGRRCICPPGGEAELAPILHYSEHALHRLRQESAAALGR
jgi:ferric-dicitrate binding protein FerR (iron transport regulator)